MSISSNENNNRSPDTETLQRLADYFEVSVYYLLCRTDNPIRHNEDFNPINEINNLLDKYNIESLGFVDLEK